MRTAATLISGRCRSQRRVCCGGYMEVNMDQAEHFDALVLGSGPGGNLLAWHLGRSGQRVVVVERRDIGGSCPNIACMGSENEIYRRA